MSATLAPRKAAASGPANRRGRRRGPAAATPAPASGGASARRRHSASSGGEQPYAASFGRRAGDVLGPRLGGFEGLPLPLYLAAPNGRVVAANSAFLDLIGLERSAEPTSLDLAALHVRTAQWRRLCAHVAGGDSPYCMEAELRRLDGRIIRVENRAWAVPLAQGGEEYVAGALYDITSQRRREARYLRRALYDSLTSLPNRHLLLERLRHALTRHRRDDGSFSLLFLDLDGFKPINDALGHLAGDALLRAIAARLLACVRREDTVARLGGDEFCVLVAAPHDVALRMAERMRTALAQPFVVEGVEARVTASIGIASASGAGGTPEELLHQADRAMYRAKAAGGDRVVGDMPVDAGALQIPHP